MATTDTLEASDLLTNLNTQGSLPARYVPRPPWCAVVTHPGLAGDVDALGWLGDFERSLTRAGNLISTEAD